MKKTPLNRYKPLKRTGTRKVNYKAKLDKIFSLYIRLRDSKAYNFQYFRCPTCGRVLPFAQADCSHYFSRVHLATRFDPDNCVAECRFDNRFNSEHLHALGIYLRQKLGEKRFALLEIRHKQIRKISEWEYKELIKYYTALVECLKRGEDV